MLISPGGGGTWSRLRSGGGGPRPVRSRAHPWGYPWLDGPRLEEIERSNRIVRASFEIAQLMASLGRPFLLEHPEDLGRDPQQDYDAANIFQLELATTLRATAGVFEGAFFQCAFGADWAGPTRVMANLPIDGLCRFPGAGILDDARQYCGPLPQFCGHRHAPT